jgi:hypothetical protein
LSKSTYSDEGMEFRGDLNIQKIIYDQIQMCNRARAQGDSMLYQECVQQLQLLLPWQQQIEVEDEHEDYEEHIEEWRPAMIDGEFGSDDPEQPDLINVPGTLRYNQNFNNGKPKQMSPIWHEETRILPDLLFKKIMQKLQGIGYTHKQDEQMNDGGDIPEGEDPPPTPTFGLPEPVEDDEDDDEG